MPSGKVNVLLVAEGAGQAPSAPSAVTSITKDAGATVSFLAPADAGDSSITSYTVTPYIGGSAQSPTTIAVGSLGSITGSDGNTYRQANVTGLTNSTAYTFSVHASNSSGAGTESTQSGANTPLSGLVFGDDFNGSASGAVDPEWWVYSRCGFIAQSEVQWYLPSQCVLDGSGNLKLTAQHTSHSGPSYPSDGNTVRNQSWISGACQSNVKTWTPTSGNTMTFEAKLQVCADSGNGYWPGLFWLNGQSALAWKTDPDQGGWNNTDHAEIDIAEWPSGQSSPTSYLNNTWVTSSPASHTENTPGTNYSAGLHTFSVQWKPGAKTTFFRDGSQTFNVTSGVPASGCQFVLLLYLQMVAGGPTTTQSCLIDYVRVFDQNLG